MKVTLLTMWAGGVLAFSPQGIVKKPLYERKSLLLQTECERRYEDMNGSERKYKANLHQSLTLRRMTWNVLPSIFAFILLLAHPDEAKASNVYEQKGTTGLSVVQHLTNDLVIKEVASSTPSRVSVFISANAVDEHPSNQNESEETMSEQFGKWVLLLYVGFSTLAGVKEFVVRFQDWLKRRKDCDM